MAHPPTELVRRDARGEHEADVGVAEVVPCAFPLIGIGSSSSSSRSGTASSRDTNSPDSAPNSMPARWAKSDNGPMSTEAADIPDAEESAAVLRGLLRLWESYGPEARIRIIDGSLVGGLQIRTLAEHCARLTEAILLLVSEGHYLTAMPLIRQTLECAVTAAWISIAPDASFAAVYESARQQKNAYDAALLQDSLFEDPARTEELADMLERFGGYKADAAKNFETRCKQLKGGESLYVYYRIFSQVAHADMSLMDEYLEKIADSGDDTKDYRFVTPAPYPLIGTALAFQVCMLVLAQSAYDNGIEGTPHATELQSIADRFGFNRDIAWSGE